MGKHAILRIAGLGAALALAMAQPHTAAAAPASLPVGHCINMGGMLDSDDWGGKKLDASDFTNIRRAGFDSVRLTTNWYNHASADAPYTIDPAWMARVTSMVDAALSNGLIVILNSHNFPELHTDPEGSAPRWRGCGGRSRPIWPRAPTTSSISNWPTSPTPISPPTRR
jgi:hypothetical protein